MVGASYIHSKIAINYTMKTSIWSGACMCVTVFDHGNLMHYSFSLWYTHPVSLRWWCFQVFRDINWHFPIHTIRKAWEPP